MSKPTISGEIQFLEKELAKPRKNMIRDFFLLMNLP
jgi:hypothetical protein